MGNPSKLVRQISDAMCDITFLPSPEQRKTKTAFYAIFNDNPLCDRNAITRDMAISLTGDTRLMKWWRVEGFRDWFINADEFRQRAEYLSHLALDTMEEVLLDRDANTAARVNAAKLMMEIANKMPSKYTKEKFLDSEIEKMNQHQLKSFIDRYSYLLGESHDQKAKEEVDTSEKATDSGPDGDS